MEQDVQHKCKMKTVSSLPLRADTRITQERDHTCHAVSRIITDEISAVLAPPSFDRYPECGSVRGELETRTVVA